jgi:DNA-binding CsgD family transcriptional regulator
VRRKNYELANPGNERFVVWVPADAALAHVKELMAAGLGYKTIARRAGVAASSVGALLFPTPSRGRGVRQKIRAVTRDRLLAVPVPGPEGLLPGQYVTAVPTTNRVRALHRLGYSMHVIAARAGLDHQRVRKAAAHPEAHTTVATHNAIADLFAELWNKPPAPSSPHAQGSATRSHNMAKRRGWPMPIEIDERGYIDADEPEADIDPIAVQRVIAGEGRAVLTSPEVMAAIALGVKQGLSFGEIAERLGSTRDAVQGRAARAGIRSEWAA